VLSSLAYETVAVEVDQFLIDGGGILSSRCIRGGVTRSFRIK